MTFERLNRVRHQGGWLWHLDLKNDRATNGLCHTRLVVEPLTHPHPEIGAELHVWFETQETQYQWITKSVDQRPKGIPTFVIADVEIPKSRRVERCKHALEYVLIEALSRGDLHGDSAAHAVHSLFWLHFVEDDDGLTYLYKYAPKDSGNFYARERLLRYTEHNRRVDGMYEIEHAIEDAMEGVKPYGPRLGDRFRKHVQSDRAIGQAIEAILLMNEPEEVRLAHVRKIVELNATRIDHVIAAIVDETHAEHALLGLRACQRAESDPQFFAAVDAFVLAHPDGRGMISFLKLHCKSAKPTKPTQEEADDYE